MKFQRCKKVRGTLNCFIEKGHEGMHYDTVNGVFWIDSLTRGLPTVEWKFYNTLDGMRVSIPIFKENDA